MKKIINLLLMSAIFVGCQKDDVSLKEHEKLNQEGFKIQLTSKLDEADFSKLLVKVVDPNTKVEFIEEVDNDGLATFNLPNNKNYDVSVEGVDNDFLYGLLKNTKVTANKALTLEVKYDIENYKGLVLDELYFNGTQNGDFNYTYYEQYFTIYNNTDESIDVSGLSFGICGDYNNTPRSSANGMISIMPKEIALSQVYTIPSASPRFLGSHESLVIALWGKNHKIPTKDEHFTKPNSLDLTGADFEIYVPHEYCMTKDEDVPNVDVNFSTFEAFHWQPTGSSPLVLFKVDGDIDAHIRNNKKEYLNPASSNRRQDYIVIPSLSIIDGVETGSKGNFTRKVLPNTIDKTYIKIPGSGDLGTGYDGYFIKRKQTSANVRKDTGKSNVDFKITRKSSLKDN